MIWFKMIRKSTPFLAFIIILIRGTLPDVLKSSRKIEDMVLKEEQILNRLYTAISETRNNTVLDYFLKFHSYRLSKMKQWDRESFRTYLKHPNGIYHSIKSFSVEYNNLRSVLVSSSWPQVNHPLSYIADEADLAGSRMSFLRLQDVYNLTAYDMIRGDYFGFLGPPLNELDAWAIGQTAFTDCRWQQAMDWLQEAIKLTRQNHQLSVGLVVPDETETNVGRILALLGRIYVRLGDQHQAKEVYRQALNKATQGDLEVKALEQELLSQSQIPEGFTGDPDYKRLCLLQNKLVREKFDPRLKCSYRPARPPYYRFKQELVSVSPYVVLFYDVVTQTEIDYIIHFSTSRLTSGLVESTGGSVAFSLASRTSDLSFVEDHESTLFADMSRRVAAATGLDTTPFKEGRSYSGEPFQVVNYGMGGHYVPHYDPLCNETAENNKDAIYFKYGGNRLATFLIYLTDVEQGGSTVFPLANLAVKPVKKMALFWYSYKPSGQLEKNTYHAACPVVIGHKWVTNKWIWLHGNTFTRRCGLRKTTNQLAIEKFMRTGWV